MGIIRECGGKMHMSEGKAADYRESEGLADRFQKIGRTRR